MRSKASTAVKGRRRIRVDDFVRDAAENLFDHFPRFFARRNFVPPRWVLFPTEFFKGIRLKNGGKCFCSSFCLCRVRYFIPLSFCRRVRVVFESTVICMYASEPFTLWDMQGFCFLSLHATAYKHPRYYICRYFLCILNGQYESAVFFLNKYSKCFRYFNLVNLICNFQRELVTMFYEIEGQN